MPEMVASKEDFLHLGGGINQGVAATHLEKNEFEDILNFVADGSAINYRAGISKLSSTAFTESLTTVFPFKLSNGDWTLLVAGATLVGKLDSVDALTALPILDDHPSGYSSDARPWVFTQYKDVWYAVRRNVGIMKRGNEDAMSDAGIVAPTVKATTADGGAGALAAGSFYCVYTYYNPDTDCESNPSPVSTVLTLAASKRVTWSAIGTSTNPQVGARRLYRTTAQPTAVDSAQYYFVATILDNSTTTYDDNIVSEDLGNAVTFKQDVPPDACFLAEVWHERMWLSDGASLFPSQYGRVEDYDALDTILVHPDDGHEIRALHSYGSRLIVGKTRGIYFVTGTDRTNFALDTLSDKHGCYSQHSMKSAEGMLFWYGGDNFYRSDGSSVTSISTFKIRTLLDAIPDNRKEYVTAAIYPTLSWYVVTIPNAAGFTRTLIYDYKADAWSPLKYESPADSPNFLLSAYDTSYGQKLYGTFAGNSHVWDLQDGYLDDATAYTATFKSSGIGQGQMGYLRNPRHVYLQTNQVAANISLLAYRDGVTTSALTRTGLSLDVTREWKAYSLHPLGLTGATWQIGLSYAGSAAFQIKAMSVELGVSRRLVGFPK